MWLTLGSRTAKEQNSCPLTQTRLVSVGHCPEAAALEQTLRRTPVPETVHIFFIRHRHQHRGIGLAENRVVVSVKHRAYISLCLKSHCFTTATI